MLDDWSRPVPDGPQNDDWLADAQPDLGPMREAAERGELAWALTLAGFAVHHCVQAGPLYRLGGVCLLPVDACVG